MIKKATSIENLIQSLKSYNVSVEVNGKWVWVDGDTYPHRKDFKEIGMKYSGRKKCWYWHKPEDSRKWFRSSYELDKEKIRDKYGSDKVQECRA